MFDPYREDHPVQRRLPLGLSLWERFLYRCGLRNRYYLVEKRLTGEKQIVGGTDDLRVAIWLLQRLTEERKRIVVDDVLLWDYKREIEYEFDEVAVLELQDKINLICGSLDDQRCDAELPP